MIWLEPARGGFPDPTAFLPLSGLEQMRTFFELGGPRPPLSYLTGITPTDAADGSAEFQMPATRWLLSPQGLIPGGALALLADGPLGCSIQTTLPPATPYTTAEISLNFLRPPAPDGAPMTSRGRVVGGGRALGLSDAVIVDARGRLLAHGSSRCFIFPALDLPREGAPAQTWEEPHYDSPHPYEREVEGEVLDEGVWHELDGLEIIRRHIDGRLPSPPIHCLTGLHPTRAEPGEASAVLPATVWLCPPTGLLQGGAIALVADIALSLAVQTTVPAGAGFAPLDLKVHFVRPVPPDGRDLRADAVVVNRGRNMAVARADVVNADGKKVAFATGSSLILGRPYTGHRTTAQADEHVAQADADA